MSWNLFSIASLPDWFWEGSETVLIWLTFALAAATVVVDSEFLKKYSLFKLRGDKAIALVTMFSAFLTAIVAAHTGAIEEKKIQDAKITAVDATQLGFQLFRLQQDAMWAIASQKWAIDDATGKITVLTSKEGKLRFALDTDEKRQAADEREQQAHEEATSPRELEQGSLGIAVAKFPGTIAFVASDTTRDEEDFALYLMTGLVFGHWKPQPLHLSGARLARGIVIKYWGNDQNARLASAALCRALTDQHLDALVAVELWESEWNSKVPKNAILVEVGRKDNNFFLNKLVKSRGAPPVPTAQEAFSSDPRDKYRLCEG